MNKKIRLLLRVEVKLLVETQSGSDLHSHRRSLQYYRRWEA